MNRSPGLVQGVAQFSPLRCDAKAATQKQGLRRWEAVSVLFARGFHERSPCSCGVQQEVPDRTQNITMCCAMSLPGVGSLP